MDRQKAIEILWPLDQPREHTPEVEEALRLLEEDQGVRDFFRRDAALAQRLARTDVSEEAPSALKERIVAAVGEPVQSVEVVSDERFAPDSTFGKPGWRHAMAVAAAITLLALGTILSSVVNGKFAIEDEYFVADFVRTASSQPITPDEGALSDPFVERFYERELGVPIRPVRFENAVITRAVVCVIEGERGSMVEYDLEGTRLAYYRIPDSVDRFKPVDLKVTSEGGYRVARWRDGDFTHALVADIPGREMRDLAIEEFASSGS